MRRRGPASAPPLSLGRPARRTPGRTSRWHSQLKAQRSRIGPEHTAVFIGFTVQLADTASGWPGVSQVIAKQNAGHH
jgi:hypothetical protein